MGHVALNAGVYLLAKLGMTVVAEYESLELFDVDQIEVKQGILQAVRRPRNRFFVWNDPEQKRDLILFLGESQPPIGKYLFCRKLVEYARDLGAERVCTFAAMATQMHPEQPSRVFGAATNAESLEELKRLELEILEDGQIGGLNGVLLGVAAESGLHGACLLGEMPHIFSQLPYPKASLAILEMFSTMSGIAVDLEQLAGQARIMDRQLGQLFAQVEQGVEPGESAEEESDSTESPEEERPSSIITARIERLFEQAAKDRSKAFELKQELDRLGVFKEYEDRFLDLFRKPSG
jgi:proteasome assembly chaperone (PAC2) family protein